MQHDWNWTRILAPNLVEAHPINSCTCVLFLALSSLVSTSLTLRFIDLFGGVLKILSCIFIFLSNILFDFAFLLELKRKHILPYVVYAIYYFFCSILPWTTMLLHLDIIYPYFPLFTHFLVGEHLGFPQFVTIINNASMSVAVSV